MSFSHIFAFNRQFSYLLLQQLSSPSKQRPLENLEGFDTFSGRAHRARRRRGRWAPILAVSAFLYVFFNVISTAYFFQFHVYVPCLSTDLRFREASPAPSTSRLEFPVTALFCQRTCFRLYLGLRLCQILSIMSAVRHLTVKTHIFAFSTRFAVTFDLLVAVKFDLRRHQLSRTNARVGSTYACCMLSMISAVRRPIRNFLVLAVRFSSGGLQRAEFRISLAIQW